MYERSIFKVALAAGALGATFLTAPAFAQVHVYIGRTPPPLRYEVRPAMPGEGYVWTEGYWGDEGGRYIWRPGVWQRPPYPGAYWSHPHYDHYDRGWQMHEGHWDREDHERHDERHDGH